MTTPMSVIEVDLDFVIEQQITLEQYCICYLLWQDKLSNQGSDSEDKYQALSYIYKYFNAVSDNQKIEGWKSRDIAYLESKGLLVNRNDPNSKYPYSADLMEVTDQFVQAVIKHGDAFDELYKRYPRFINVNGKRIGPCKMADVFELTEIYDKVVRTKKKHREIMELLDWGLKKGHVTCGVEKFVKSRYWRELKDIKKNGSTEGDNYDQETLL